VRSTPVISFLFYLFSFCLGALQLNNYNFLFNLYNKNKRRNREKQNNNNFKKKKFLIRKPDLWKKSNISKITDGGETV